MKYDNDSYKMSFFNHLKKLQTNYNTRTLLTKAMEEYNNRFQLAPSDRFDKEVENFARILASSTPINKISEVGLYALVYSKPNEQFTFLDSFPIIYCFNQSDIEHQTIAGINLNRLEKKHSLIYLKAQMKENANCELRCLTLLREASGMTLQETRKKLNTPSDQYFTAKNV